MDSLLLFSGRLLLRANRLDDIDHVSVTHAFMDVFIFQPPLRLASPRPHSSPLHASCFMFHAHAISSYPLFGSDVRSVLRCIAARSLFR